MSKIKIEREERTLARPLRVAGVQREPGATVRLRPDQIARLEPDGYFEKTHNAERSEKGK